MTSMVGFRDLGLRGLDSGEEEKGLGFGSKGLVQSIKTMVLNGREPIVEQRQCDSRYFRCFLVT